MIERVRRTYIHQTYPDGNKITFIYLPEYDGDIENFRNNKDYTLEEVEWLDIPNVITDTIAIELSQYSKEDLIKLVPDGGYSIGSDHESIGDERVFIIYTGRMGVVEYIESFKSMLQDLERPGISGELFSIKLDSNWLGGGKLDGDTNKSRE